MKMIASEADWRLPSSAIVRKKHVLSLCKLGKCPNPLSICGCSKRWWGRWWGDDGDDVDDVDDVDDGDDVDDDDDDDNGFLMDF